MLTDIRAMLCADGLAISRSTLHFLTFAHSRAKHLMIPSECGPGWYARGLKDERSVEKHGIRKKPNPNNTTLLCIEKPDTEVSDLPVKERGGAGGPQENKKRRRTQR